MYFLNFMSAIFLCKLKGLNDGAGEAMLLIRNELPSKLRKKSMVVGSVIFIYSCESD